MRSGKKFREEQNIKNFLIVISKIIKNWERQQNKLYKIFSYSDLKNYKFLGVIAGINENFGPESFEPPGCKTVSKFLFLSPFLIWATF